MKYFCVVVFSFIISIQLFSQLDESPFGIYAFPINGLSAKNYDTVKSINQYLESIRNAESKWIDSAQFRIDKIEIKTKRTKSLLFATCDFKRKYPPVKCWIYTKHGKITYAEVTETSIHDFQSYSSYYYSDDEVVYRDFMSTTTICAPQNFSSEGYDPAITSEFLEKFFFTLMKYQEQQDKKKARSRKH